MCVSQDKLKSCSNCEIPQTVNRFIHSQDSRRSAMTKVATGMLMAGAGKAQAEGAVASCTNKVACGPAYTGGEVWIRASRPSCSQQPPASAKNAQINLSQTAEAIQH